LSQLAGKRVGIPEWAQTAAVYSRGMLAHEFGVALDSIEWVQAGVNEAGRREKVKLKVPAGIRYRPEPERSLTEMLESGDLDAVLSARPPHRFTDGSGKVRRLLADPRGDELAYWKKTGIFPIMHVVAMRRDILKQHPWVAMNLLQAFEEAKRRSLARVSDVTASAFPLPWIADYAQISRDVLGADFWPYGIEPNRPTLDAFLRFAWEQGVLHRQLAAEEIFAATTQSHVHV
jgi:4,5-dihydroxyphthalate decarboxylase